MLNVSLDLCALWSSAVGPAVPLRAAARRPGMSRGWLHGLEGRAWPRSPGAGGLGTGGGACAVGRGCAWRGWAACRTLGRWRGVRAQRGAAWPAKGARGLQEQRCCGAGPHLPQRRLVKKIVGKANFDKILETIKESLSSLSHIKTL